MRIGTASHKIQVATCRQLTQALRFVHELLANLDAEHVDVWARRCQIRAEMTLAAPDVDMQWPGRIELHLVLLQALLRES